MTGGGRCVMGCERLPGRTFHRFPSNPERRAEWCRILGVYPKTKEVLLCNTHFSDHYIFGAKVSKFAVPNPPDSQMLNNLMLARRNEKPRYQIQKIDSVLSRSEISENTISGLSDDAINNLMVARRNEKPRYQIQKIDSVVAHPEISENTIPALSDDDSLTTFPETEICFPQNQVKANNLVQDPLQDNSNIQFSSEAENETGESQEIFKKVEDFEICKGINKDMIIKGRYVQTNDYLVVSYTPPRKWSLQEQVNILDKTSKQQLQTIRQLKNENYRLSMALKKHEKLLPTLRYLQMHNRYLCAQLKLYKIHEKNLRERERIKKKRLKNNKGVALQENNTEA